MGALTLAGSLGSAIVIGEQSTPLVRNIENLSDFDGDVLSVRDQASPALSAIHINWPSGALDSNRGYCVSVFGDGAGFTINELWAHGCGLGGLLIERAHHGFSYSLSDLRIDASQGVPQASGQVNRKEGFGVWLAGGAQVTINGAAITRCNGHGIMVRNAALTLTDATLEDNGQQPLSATSCHGGNALEVNVTGAQVDATRVAFRGSKGRTSPPPSGIDACATGDGARVGRGSAAFTDCTFTGNSFDGLLVEATATAASATRCTFAGNGANGVEVQTLSTVDLSGNNRYAACPGPVGNGRANLCFVTPSVPATLRAPNGAWQRSPLDAIGDDDPQAEIPGDPEDIIAYDASSNRHCAGYGAHDIIIVSAPNVAPPSIPVSQVLSSPSSTLSCP
jgi:Right handed beta helix region